MLCLSKKIRKFACFYEWFGQNALGLLFSQCYSMTIVLHTEEKNYILTIEKYVYIYISCIDVLYIILI